ncbi:serine/threonine protein kinase [Phytophthora cinnamomi]|uniref:serine/threonine protein kinase n=1 Tax=Phytophthora cinnamomi TaxID=4785 RepID=UPI003559DD64|nr:serine/threonine protein kinase [Phytophthora cinnamomi]
MMNMMEATDSDSDAEFAAKGAKTPLWSGTAYSSAISKSMRAMMTSSRLRGGRQGAAAAGKDAGAELFADAVARKDKEKMLDALAKDPSVLRRSDENGWLPLHHVCALRPNYRYVDLMTMMVNTYPEAVRCADKNGRTPLHTLCGNTCVTVQALGVFAASLAELTLARDNAGNLPLHHLCRNSSCDVGLIKKLGSDTSAYAAINDEGQTPLHCLVTIGSQLNKPVLYHLLESFPNTALMRDLMGRTILHWMCELHDLDPAVIQTVLAAAVDSASLPDSNGDLPLHTLCQNEKLTRELLRLVLQAYPAGIYSLAKDNLSPLHFLCSNENCSADILTDFFSVDSDNSSCAKADKLGATALHILCMNESISTELLRTTLLMCCEDSITQDVHGRSPLHYLCMNHSVSPELLWLLFDRGHDLVRQVDRDERTPLHYLCSNIKVTPRVLEILFDSWPSAALVVDRDFKLPVQYLVDNPSSSPETTTLLICGPASYRHRYEFLSVNGQCACFTQGSEAVYVQTNVAMDSNTATKVLVNFYSPQSVVNHEQSLLLRLKTTAEIRNDNVNYSLIVHEMFENAKRRLTLRSIEIAPEDHNGDATITLDYALVMEAPLYTLESLRAEQICDTEAARAITTEVANCLVFWHCDARMVHGNITLQNVGQFEDRGLCLFNLNTSRELYEQRTIGSHAIALSSCPPEAAKAFIAKEEFLPTLASDMWQFGCIVYQLLSGSTLLERLAPWSSSIGHEQGLHLICSLTDAVLETLIAETEPEFRVLLQRTLIVNPSYRWGIDRLMLIEDGLALPSFVTSEAPSHDFVGKTLQQKTEDALADGTERSRSIKHAHEQLGFMKKEQSLLRHTLLSTKSQLRDVDQARTNLQLKLAELQTQMTSEVHQKQEAQLEAQLLARNHQAMTLQLHTTVQMLLNLVPLARKVYGAAADDFLSSALAQSTGSAPPNAFAADPASLRRKSGPVQLLKSQLQHSVLAHGCVQKWANSSPSSALAATSLALSDENSGSNVTTDDTSDDNEEKARSQAEDFDVGGGAAAVA